MATAPAAAPLTMDPDDVVDDVGRGRRAAFAIFQDDADPSTFHDPFSVAFAQAATERFAELHAGRAKVYDKVFSGANQSASSQSEHKFQGINEVIQNADDQRASWLRVGFADDLTDCWLLFAHNGTRVDVGHVLPMTLPFLTTKTSDAEAAGRFGIGLKTLNRLGDRLEVHSAPYHFASEHNDIHLAPAWPGVPGLYEPEEAETLLCLRLANSEDREGIATWIESFDPSALVFLRSIRHLSLVSTSGAVAVEHGLVTGSAKQIRSRSLPDPVHTIESVGLRTIAGDRRWTRYTWRVRVPVGLAPRHKSTTDHTAVSLALPNTPEPGQLFVWLPTPQKGWLPFHINADFEPTVDRESVQDTEWNRWLLERLGDLAAAVIARHFEERPRLAWRDVPLVPADPHGYAPWLEQALERTATLVHERLAAHAELSIGSRRVPLGRIGFEAPALEGLVGAADLERLLPDTIALPTEVRDRSGIWRRVMAVVPAAEELTVITALKMLDWKDETLGQRPPSFFVGIVSAALDARLQHLLENYSCVLTSAHLRVKPSASAKELLVEEQSGKGLAVSLGLAHAIHPEYLRSSPRSAAVRDWLEKNHHLAKHPSAQKTLSALHAKASNGHVELDQETLRLLRDELGKLDEEQREHHGLRIGSVIWVDGFTYESGKRSKAKVRPSEAYQPKAIDKQPHKLSWAEAASETPGLKWIDSRYADSLATSQRQLGSGPGAFLRTLGARTAPRLETSPRTLELRGAWAYGTMRTVPPFQREAIARLGAPVDGLQDDHVSPDLAAVCRDIAAAPMSDARRLRARALLHAMSRQWDDFRDEALATTVQAYYALRPTGRVPATWVADMASIDWMSSQADAPALPHSLVLDTPETRLVFGDDDQRFAAEVGEGINEGFLRALGLELSPSSDDIVQQLQALRDDSQAQRTIDEGLPGRLYRVLAGRIHGQTSRRGDLSRKQLRAKFGIEKDRPGLIYTGGTWHSPNAVFLEPPIFKTRRPFAPDRPALRPLWDALSIGRPNLTDCLDVLLEVAAADPGPDEEAVLLDTHRYLEDLIPRASRRERERLSRLPLWTGGAWRSSTPVYAVHQAPDLRASLARELPTWSNDRPLDLPNLVTARGVRVLERRQFEPSGLSLQGILESGSLAELFTSAVGHLRDILAVRDPVAYERLRTGWKALEAARVWLCPDLTLRAEVGSDVVEIPARAHIVESVPVDVFLATDEDAAAAAVGGAVIASLFSEVASGVGIDFIWQYAWLAATSGQTPKGIRLAEHDDTPEPEPENGTAGETRQPRRRAGMTSDPESTGGQRTSTTAQPLQTLPPPEPRNLKDFSVARVVSAGSSGQDGAAGTVHRPKHAPLVDDPKPKPRTPESAPRTYRNYSDEQREDAGVAALRIVLDQQGRLLHDMRRQRGVGSDVRDDRGKYYELKVHGGEMPDEVTLEDTQLERALREGANFVLAVVAGVEQDEKTVIKLIQNPAERLKLKAANKLSLFGIKATTGDEFEIVTENASTSPPEALTVGRSPRSGSEPSPGSQGAIE